MFSVFFFHLELVIQDTEFHHCFYTEKSGKNTAMHRQNAVARHFVKTDD